MFYNVFNLLSQFAPVNPTTQQHTPLPLESGLHTPLPLQSSSSTHSPPPTEKKEGTPIGEFVILQITSECSDKKIIY